MNDKMRLLVVKETRHVLGAVTLNAESEQVLGNAGILVRFDKKTTTTSTSEMKPFEVAADELEAAAATDLDMAVVLKPLDYLAEESGAATKLTGSVSNVELETNKITVTVSTAVTDETSVWVQIFAATLPSPRIAKGKILKEKDECVIEIETLESGTYFFAALAKGHAIYTSSKTLV